MSDSSHLQSTPSRLYREELDILKLLGNDVGGFTTHGITIHMYGNADLRRDSQFVRQKLVRLQRQGMVAPMDAEKPVLWRRTKAGTEALRAR